jgi:molybdate transport system substrate-binding protein
VPVRCIPARPLLALVAACLGAGLGTATPSRAAAQPPTASTQPPAVPSQLLTVSAAASLTEAMREIGARFEAARPGVMVRFNFASSGVLVQQIVQGAPVDVFASADQETMERGIARKVIDPATRRDFARNAVVMIAPTRGAPGAASLSGLADLRRPDVRRVALGKPATVPAGRYAKQALDRAGLWAVLEPKLVHAENVRQVLDYVARGEVEAGFVYRTDAALLQDKARVVLTIEGGDPVTYPVAVVADSRQPALARDFHGFLLGPEAQAVLARHGFARP